MTAARTSDAREALVRVDGLKKYFPVRRGILRRQVGAIRAVDGIGFDIRPGETLGLVGESGSGKSTAGRSLLRLEEPDAGRVWFDGQDLARLDADRLKDERRRMQMIFQDPYASLNPRIRVGKAIREPLDIHEIGDAHARDATVCELLERVGLNADHATRYPHEFSGGQRQRIGIARALATRPEFIVADEPISALDVSIQAQIVNLLSDLKAELGLTYLFIAHDLSMVRHLSDRVAVMYLGRIVELGDCDRVFERPLHPYTRTLISAVPAVPRRAPEDRRSRPSGRLANPADPPSGCSFHTRCPFATALCRTVSPELVPASGDASHVVACHHVEQIPRDEMETVPAS